MFTYFPKLPPDIRLIIRRVLSQLGTVPLEQDCLGKCRKAIGEWEDENNAVWLVVDSVVVPKPAQGNPYSRQLTGLRY